MPIDLEDPIYKLIREQLARYRDSFDARLVQVETQLMHNAQLNEERVSNLRTTITTITSDVTDHENRIRDLRDSAMSFKTVQSLFSGGSLIASITALIRSIFGS